jgi:curved DNA-binding protein CbpA
MKKYFDILELDGSASIEEAEQAYKELAEAWRPESYQNLPRFKRKAEIKLKEVNDAYERVRSYLLVKQSDADQKVFALPADRSPEPEPLPAEGTQPPQISSPSQRKKLLLGLIAGVAVVSGLMLYLISDRQKPQKQKLQTIVAAKEKPAPHTASAPVSAEHLKKGSELNSAGKFNAEKRSASAKTAANNTPMPKRPDTVGRLTQKALSRYNRNPVRVKKIQNGLITVGYNTGPIDGVIGPLTTGALKQFAGDHDHIIEAGGLLASDLTNAVLVFAEVAATHPDWDRIIGSQNFKRWLDGQTYMSASQVKKLKKSATARQVIDVLALYKSDKKKP